MATPTRMVIHFDDGTSIEVSLAGMSSVFMNEAAAVKCGHRPPYQQGPPPKGGSAPAGATTMTAMGGSCYYLNGVIICP
jgi:hypothetical protein